MITDTISSQQKILSLACLHSDMCKMIASDSMGQEIFSDPSHKRIFRAACWSADRKKPLSQEAFEHYCSFVERSSPAELASTIPEFILVTSGIEADALDFDILLKEAKNDFHVRWFRNQISELRKNKGKDFSLQLSQLNDKLSKVLSSNSSSVFEFYDTGSECAPFVSRLKEQAQNPEEKIKCGIKEIDECMVVGFRPGTLTLTVADVGGAKTTMMLNIAFNLFKRGHNVLFVPLEMPFEEIFKKYLSRETLIPFERFASPNELTPEDWARLESKTKELESTKSRLVWADVKSRPSVQEIKQAIESKMSFFKPTVVVIDYIANIRPDGDKENWLAIGDILKDLRAMGKQHGFAILSAAQMTRDGIKKLKGDKDQTKSPGSEDLRGSHEYSADSDNIFAQAPWPDEPNRKLMLFCIKARYGKKNFDGKNYALLDFYPEYSKIESSSSNNFDANDEDLKRHMDALVNGISSNNSDSKKKNGSSKSVSDDFSWFDDA